MNITFMIGNGFDINLGLSTKYTDFIEVYCNDTKNDDDIIKKFKKDIIKQNLPLWANAEMAFGQQTSLISENFTVEDYCNCHSHFCATLAGYLKEEQKRLIINKENSSIIATSFSNAVNNLTVGFRAVQREQIGTFIDSYNSGIIFNFVDFNYTNTLDLLCAHTNSSIGWKSHQNIKNAMGKFIHVHGTVKKDMVLGVHDESQIANVECFKSVDDYYLAQLIKSQTDAMNEENTYKQALQVLNSSHLIYIYGMSIGDTDKLWWKKICQLLIQNSGLHVIFHCHNMPENELQQPIVKRFKDKQIERLFDLGEIDKDVRNSLLGRVHITGANIFHELNNIVSQRNEQAKAS